MAEQPREESEEGGGRLQSRICLGSPPTRGYRRGAQGGPRAVLRLSPPEVGAPPTGGEAGETARAATGGLKKRLKTRERGRGPGFSPVLLRTGPL